MTCGIYKIENKLNGKVYIGQSIHIEKRWIDHKNNYTKLSTKLYRNMIKDGIENFEFSIIEECKENELDNKEDYWILKYNCVENGYNSIYGQYRKNYCKKFTKEKFKELQIELVENKLTINELCKKYNATEDYIYRVNNGHTGRNEIDFSYPLRKTDSNKWIDDDTLESIYEDLFNSNLPMTKIAKKYGFYKSSIYAINKGDSHYQEWIKYPIRIPVDNHHFIVNGELKKM